MSPMLQSTEATSVSWPLATMAMLAITRCSSAASWSPLVSQIRPIRLLSAVSSSEAGSPCSLWMSRAI
uniref:Uncharacterized protein n=1 Tax=Arundo donax TaxID=35708 RepID=A0A0A9DYB2_ARUDO